jgi:hypothetical protein
MELKVQSAKNRMILDESIFNRNKKIRARISEIDLRDRISHKSSKLNYETAKKQLAQLQAQLEMSKVVIVSTLKSIKNQRITVKKCFAANCLMF